MTTTQQTKVIAGPAGHWYALENEVLVGLPMSDDPDEVAPMHPSLLDDPADDYWYEITDPAPETDVKALYAELKS